MMAAFGKAAFLAAFLLLASRVDAAWAQPGDAA
jgi:hypothetical protein